MASTGDCGLGAIAPSRRDLLAGVGAAAALTCSPAARAVAAADLPDRAPLELRLDMVHHNPGEPVFVTKYNDPAYLRRQGYTGQIPRIFLPCAISYDRFDPTLMPPGSAARRKTEAYAAEVDDLIAHAEAAGLPLYPFTDLLVVPKTLQAKYGADLATPGQAAARGTLGGTSLPASILQPQTEALVRAQIGEIFDRFPGLGGLTIRYGETYLFEWPDYVGSSPATTAEEQARLITVLRDEICVKRGKRLFYRTWGFGPFHTNAEFYLRVTDAVEPHPLLCFSIKHVEADFMRLHPFNQCLGIGKHRQIVEISCNQAGLYGKNAHPYYIGQGVIDGWEELPLVRSSGPANALRDLVGHRQLAGIWTWSRGDGWRGPYIANELWVDLDEQVLHRFAREPWRTEPDIFADAARAVFGINAIDLPKLRTLCLLSASATMHGQDTVHLTTAEWRAFERPGATALTGTYRQQWWCRDDGIGGIDLRPVVKAGKQRAVLAEKARASSDWRTIEALARSIRLPDPARQEFLEVSASYGRIKYALFETIWRIQLIKAESELGKTPLDAAAMRAGITRYDEIWAEWNRLRAAHACCPTLPSDQVVQYIDEPPFRVVLEEYRNAVF